MGKVASGPDFRVRQVTFLFFVGTYHIPTFLPTKHDEVPLKECPDNLLGPRQRSRALILFDLTVILQSRAKIAFICALTLNLASTSAPVSTSMAVLVSIQTPGVISSIS